MGEFLRAEEVYGDLSPTGRKAVDYVRAGLAVIPLKPGDKVPATNNGVNNWTTDTDAVADYWYRNPSASVGIVCGQPSHNLVVIDVDRHGDVDGMGSIAEWATSNGMELPETVTFETGSGGRHYLYRTAQEVRGSINGELAVDVKGKGGYIVAPPSLHPNGEYYEELVGLDDVPIAEADAAVYSLIESVRPSSSMGEGERRHFELPETIPNGQRNDTLYRYACSLRARRMDRGEIRALLDVQNLRCSEPLPHADLDKIADSVSKLPSGPSAEATAVVKATAGSKGGGGEEEKAEAVEVRSEPMKDETSDLILGEMLKFKDLVEGLRTNRSDGRLYVLKQCIPGASFDGQHPITDGERSLLFAHFERVCGVRNRTKFMSALDSFAALESQRFDPIADAVREVASRPRPAGPVRGTILNKYLGAEMSSYTVTSEIVMFRQLVARAFHPGCKADVMFIFVGGQGTGKSTFVSQLALRPEFFLEGMNSFAEEDIKRLAGRTVVEIAELDSFTRSDINTIKRVITTRKDTYRKAYARDEVDRPRTALFFGTTNDMEFLTDSTGNRRFLIVECAKEGKAHPGIFDGRLSADIAAAIGETVDEYDEMGPEGFLASLILPDETAREAMGVQDEHSIEDVIQSAISDYMEGLPLSVDVVNVRKVMREALDYQTKDISKESKYTVAHITRCIDAVPGWVRSHTKQTRVPEYGCSKNAWVREHSMRDLR